MVNDRLEALAPDLRRVAPRSAHAPLGPYRIIAARAVDKCRAELAGRAGSYHYNCPLDRTFFDFTGIDAAEFKQFVGTGQTTTRSSVGSPRNRAFVTSGWLPGGAAGSGLIHYTGCWKSTIGFMSAETRAPFSSSRTLFDKINGALRPG